MAESRRTMREIWQQTTEMLRPRLNVGAWEMYILPLTPVSYEAGVLTLAAPTEAHVEVLSVRLDRVIRDELRHQAGRAVVTRYECRGGGASC